MICITSFGDGPYRFLSNFWPAEVRLSGLSYLTVEHAYQAAKTFDPEQRELIRGFIKPGHAKRAGRTVTVRADWDRYLKIEVMRNLLTQKFAKGSPLADQLDATGDAELREGNHWGDTFWGVCNGVGENNLGRLLMEIRATNRL